MTDECYRLFAKLLLSIPQDALQSLEPEPVDQELYDKLEVICYTPTVEETKIVVPAIPIEKLPNYLVMVGRYTYYTNIPNLEVGDIVELPESWLGKIKSDGPQQGVITALQSKSDYDGEIKKITKLIRKVKDEAR